MPIPVDLVSIREAATIADLHRDSIYRLIERGKLQAYGRQHRLRVSLSDLLARYQPRVNESQPSSTERKLNGVQKKHLARVHALAGKTEKPQLKAQKEQSNGHR